MSSEQNTSQADHTLSDGIDLFELFAKLWAHRWWVVAIMAISVIFAVNYLVTVKSTFKATAFVRPPLESSFSEVNFSKIEKLSVGEAFERFQHALMSKAVRYQFFSDKKIRSGFIDGETKLSEEQLFLKFESRLDVSAFFEEQLKSDTRALSFQHADPEYAAEVVNGIIVEANNYAVEDFRGEFEVKRKTELLSLEKKVSQLVESAAYNRNKKIVELKERNLLALQNASDKLEVLRKKAKQKRYDRIEKLKEAISIAKELNLIKPATISSLVQSSRGMVSQTAVNTEVTQRNDPLYLRGVELLNAELRSLVRRANDDFTDPAIRESVGKIELLKKHREAELLMARQDDEAFIMSQLSPLKGEIGRLKSLDMDFSKVKFSRLDQSAIVSIASIKPRGSLIIVLSLIFGAVVSLLVVLILLSIERRKGM